MKNLFYIVLAILFVACSKFDDADIWTELNSQSARIAKLEQLCSQMNTNISSLQSILNALQNEDYIKNVSPIIQGSDTIGYTITFAKSNSITIYHGKDGDNGKDGTNGKDGQTPVIGVNKHTDGKYYWTLNGEWLTDNDGNKIKAEGIDGSDGQDGEDGLNGSNGTNGNDGITPQLKIEEGYWHVSYDKGTTWTQLDKATGEDGDDGEDGDSFFLDVTEDDNNVYITLLSGEIITISKTEKEDSEDNKIITDKFDKIFAQTLQNRGYIPDASHIYYKDVKDILELQLDDGILTSLDGIEYFTSLKQLYCNNNLFITLDLSKAISITKLHCGSNKYLTSITVNPNIKEIQCADCKLTSLDLSECPVLQTLTCSMNSLTSLTVKSIYLTKLLCIDNELASLDLSECTSLQTLECGLNQLSSLNLNSDFIKVLSCSSNKLTSLDLSNCSLLSMLNCASNELAYLVLNSTYLYSLQCDNNHLTSLDLSNITNITQLNCSNNLLTYLDLSNCNLLKTLYCENNQLVSLGLKGCTYLDELYCENNQLASLDLKGYTYLRRLNCYNNKLTCLDLGSCAYLEDLNCSDNPGNNEVFVVISLFDESSIPPHWGGGWYYNGKNITIDYQKVTE